MLKVNGRITGAPIGADASPNATPPKANRIITTPLRNGHSLGGSFSAFCFLEDGTSLDITVWVRVPGLSDSWHTLNVAATVTALAATIIPNIPPDADIFLQVTSPVGNPTTFAFSCV